MSTSSKTSSFETLSSIAILEQITQVGFSTDNVEYFPKISTLPCPSISQQSYIASALTSSILLALSPVSPLNRTVLSISSPARFSLQSPSSVIQIFLAEHFKGTL